MLHVEFIRKAVNCLLWRPLKEKAVCIFPFSSTQLSFKSSARWFVSSPEYNFHTVFPSEQTKQIYPRPPGFRAPFGHISSSLRKMWQSRSATSRRQFAPDSCALLQNNKHRHCWRRGDLPWGVLLQVCGPSVKRVLLTRRPIVRKGEDAMHWYRTC